MSVVYSFRNKCLGLCRFLLLAFTIIPFGSHAADYQKDLEALVSTEMKLWAGKDIVVNAVKAQNEKNADLSVTDMKILDTKWMAEKRKSKHPLIKRVLSGELSEYLQKIQEESDGLYTEIIVIDNKGMNVGQSIMSQNYWQGQQPKWEKTFGARSYATYVSDLHFDDNTELFQVELSFMIMADDEPIGVLYAGIDVEKLGEWKKRKEEQ
ncbi:MAG: hypothetical protein K0R98_1190 [Rickettsiaceae bacterium]|jgi:hypothetical protein|nr:hypothetical protein [Rickettsiaceae bacterium]